MDDTVREYRATLEAAMGRLQPYITASRIVGSDMSQFLSVNRNDRGAEIYCNEEAAFILDPAVGEELQGEIVYPSLELAMEAAVRWLDGCALDDLRPAV